MNLNFSDKKGFYKILFFILTLIVIFTFAIIPTDHIYLHTDYDDKIKHLFAFFTLSLILNRASSSIVQRFRNMSALLLFGIGIEFVQHYIPARSSSIEDIFSDVAGILLFQILYSLVKFIKNLKKT